MSAREDLLKDISFETGILTNGIIKNPRVFETAKDGKIERSINGDFSCDHIFEPEFKVMREESVEKIPNYKRDELQVPVTVQIIENATLKRGYLPSWLDHSIINKRRPFLCYDKILLEDLHEDNDIIKRTGTVSYWKGSENMGEQIHILISISKEEMDLLVNRCESSGKILNLSFESNAYVSYSFSSIAIVFDSEKKNRLGNYYHIVRYSVTAKDREKIDPKEDIFEEKERELVTQEEMRIIKIEKRVEALQRAIDSVKTASWISAIALIFIAVKMF